MKIAQTPKLILVFMLLGFLPLGCKKDKGSSGGQLTRCSDGTVQQTCTDGGSGSSGSSGSGSSGSSGSGLGCVNGQTEDTVNNKCVDNITSCKANSQAFQADTKTCFSCLAQQKLSAGSCIVAKEYCASQGQELNSSASACIYTKLSCESQGKGFNPTIGVCVPSSAQCQALGGDISTGQTACQFAPGCKGVEGLTYTFNQATGVGKCVPNQTFCKKTYQTDFNPTTGDCYKTPTYCMSLEGKSFVDASGQCASTLGTPSVELCARNFQVFVNGACAFASDSSCALGNKLKYDPAQGKCVSATGKEVCERRTDGTNKWVSPSGDADDPNGQCLKDADVQRLFGDELACTYDYTKFWDVAANKCFYKTSVAIRNSTGEVMQVTFKSNNALPNDADLGGGFKNVQFTTPPPFSVPIGGFILVPALTAVVIKFQRIGMIVPPQAMVPTATHNAIRELAVLRQSGSECPTNDPKKFCMRFGGFGHFQFAPDLNTPLNDPEDKLMKYYEADGITSHTKAETMELPIIKTNPPTPTPAP